MELPEHMDIPERTTGWGVREGYCPQLFLGHEPDDIYKNSLLGNSDRAYMCLTAHIKEYTQFQQRNGHRHDRYYQHLIDLSAYYFLASFDANMRVQALRKIREIINTSGNIYLFTTLNPQQKSNIMSIEH